RAGAGERGARRRDRGRCGGRRVRSARRVTAPPRRVDADGGGAGMTTAIELRRIPGIVRDVEVSKPLPHIPPRDAADRRVAQAWLLVRIFTEPLGLLTLDIPDTGLPAAS